MFIHSEIEPPETITIGEEGNDNNGQLHFGYLYYGDAGQALFFVIHPNSFRPYQHRFATNTLTSYVQTGLAALAKPLTAAVGVAIGTIVPPAEADRIVTSFGGVAGQLPGDIFGDYLRYIG